MSMGREIDRLINEHLGTSCAWSTDGELAEAVSKLLDHAWATLESRTALAATRMGSIHRLQALGVAREDAALLLDAALADLDGWLPWLRHRSQANRQIARAA